MKCKEDVLHKTERYLQRLILDAAELPRADIDTAAPFGELGINSFHVLKIIKKLETIFGMLPKSLLFEHFTVQDLAGYFVAKHEERLNVEFAALSDAHGNATIAEPSLEALPERSGFGAGASNQSLRVSETDLHGEAELKAIVESLFQRYKAEGCVSRGTRKIAPNLFVGGDRKGYFNYGRNNELLLVYAYTGAREDLPRISSEILRDCVERSLQLNILSDEPLTSIDGVPFTATPFGVLQRVLRLQDFSLDGGPMRRLRYQVSKFEKTGATKTLEYRCGTNPETDRQIASIIDQWCETKAMVNPLIKDVQQEILSGNLASGHRLFLTTLDDVLQNVILITPMSAEQNGYLMDLEFYLPDMPLGGLEFAIVKIIAVLAAEGCDMLSLGGTYGCKIDASPSPTADTELEKILDELRERKMFNDEGNLQFKNKFRPENRTIFLCRPKANSRPENVIDIIMMIADPTNAQIAETKAPMSRHAASADSTVRKMVAALAEGHDGHPRFVALAKHGFNPLNIAAHEVEIDFKTDSWAQLATPGIDAHLRELLSQLQCPVELEEGLRTVFPFAHFALADSGSAAERIFFKAWSQKGAVPQNILFPSTIFHQLDHGFTPREIPDPAIFRVESSGTCNAETCLDALREELARDSKGIALVCIELCNNASGGQLVSVSHLRQVRALLSAARIPLVLDATRVLENSRLLIEREPEYARSNMWTVARETLSCADVVIASLTKDFCVKRGGIVATNDEKLYSRMQHLLQEEGGGVDSIDLKTIAIAMQGRKRIEAKVLRRMDDVCRIWHALRDQGVPVVAPAGGHCVLIDVKRLPEFQGLAQPVASFLAWLYLHTGIRGAPHSVGMCSDTALSNLVRLAVPVGAHASDIDEAIVRLKGLFDHPEGILDLDLDREAARAREPFLVHYRLNAYRGELASPAATREQSIAQPTVMAASATVRVKATAPQRKRAGRETEKPQSADIAIIGMAGRYPKANSNAELWRNLQQGRDCIEEIPEDRYRRRLAFEHIPRYRGGFVDAVDRFDSLFFNISPREAEMLDPQERLFLEVAWEAIEDAGYHPENLAREEDKRDIGVFVGAVWTMYQMLGIEERVARSKVTPNSFLWSIANRVSYWMNFSGPSLTLDTACSSSLTALHLACEAILSGDCSAAIVGGVNLDLHQAKLDINLNGGALSDDGVCRSFGKGANGYVAGEGVGALLLKPLERAISDGDHIYGVVKSTAVNHGGRTSGYTVPSPKAQAGLITAALDKAGIDARSIGFIEAHGTGTELGDPIEIAGLGTAFKAHRVENQSCAIGSIKSNIGHLEAAAGVAGIAKVLLQMRHRQLVPSLHSNQLNEFIDFADSPFCVQQGLEPWLPKDVEGSPQRLRAGVSSFGAGGANAHVILESYEQYPEADGVDEDEYASIFPFSARSEEQLREMVSRFAAYLRDSDEHLGDIAHTLQVGRRSFDHRLVAVARSKAALLQVLECYLESRKSSDLTVGRAHSAEGVTRLLNRAERDEFVRLLLQTRAPRQLAELWVEGLLTDWPTNRTGGRRRRVSLPTYPFADKRHWASAQAIARPIAQMACLHPLLDSNESTFERQIFKKIFHDRDFFIYDHQVAEIPTLPGTAYLELARKAGEIAAGRKVRRIRNILWLSPIAVRNGRPHEVFIELKPSGDAVQFEVFSKDDQGGKLLHSQGKLFYETRLEAEAQDEYIDVAAIRDRCKKAIDGTAAYPLFKSLGLGLGPSFQVLQEVFKNEEETLGILKLPASRLADLEGMPLHPSLVDGSMQAGMGAQLGGKVDEMFVPFSIGEVEILHALQPDCFSYVTEAKDQRKKNTQVLKTNVLIVDNTGKVLVRISESAGVPLREIHKKPPLADGEGFARLLYEYDWQSAPIDSESPIAATSLLLLADDDGLRNAYQECCREAGIEVSVVQIRTGERFSVVGDDVYTVDPLSREDYMQLFRTLQSRGSVVENICFAWPLEQPSPSNADALERQLSKGVYAFLPLCQALLDQKPDGAAQLLYVYGSSSQDIRPQDEAIAAFVKAVQLEHSRFVGKVVDVRASSRDHLAIAKAVLAETRVRSATAVAVRYEGGERAVRTLKMFEKLEPAANGVSLRREGVYVITGGAGGVGLRFAEFLGQEYQAKLVLCGRSAPTPQLDARMEAIRQSGAEVSYVRADVSTRDGAHRILAEARARHGAINGVIHGAGVIRDAFVKNKDAAQMRAVFEPKIFGIRHLDEACGDEPLDFFVALSSLAGVAGNAGQCDYSYANHFMDAYLRQREAARETGLRHGKALSINWSLWEEGGMALDPQTLQYFKRTLGLHPLPTPIALDAFVRGLASRHMQFAVLFAVQEKIETAWGMRKKPAPQAVAAPSKPAAAGSQENELVAWLQDGMSRIVMDFLKLEMEDVSPDKILLDLGFDSIGLTTFANMVNEKYQLDITPVLFFDYPSIREIAKHLVSDKKDDLLRIRGVDAVTPPSKAQAVASEELHVRVENGKGWDSARFDEDRAARLEGQTPSYGSARQQPIAIVGMSGVMPQSEDLDAFWENLSAGRDLITEIPPDRWDWRKYYGDPLKEVNKSNSKWGGFMHEVDKFDPLFFGISPREAEMMDPQQRLFLQTVWRAVEDSGHKVSDLSGTRTGLFVGVATNDYADIMNGRDLPLDGYSASGNSHSVLANRISFLLNLRGPSAPIDTACSSSLVALHRAVQAMHAGDCDMAIVGGVQVMLTPAAYISFGMAGMLSSDGKCKTFDKRADGYVRGEGVGAILLKSLAAAEADGDPIYAVIKATSENHGGRVTTLTAPNSIAQKELLVEAYGKAQIDPASVGYIECHGTGTSLGDPIEIQALIKAFAELYKRQGTPPPSAPHCGLSSVKTNIGHLETAAGIAGVLKALLALKNKEIPANVHLEELNPYINLEGTPFYIARKLTPWNAPADDSGHILPRRAGISSFGFGGANAHIVLEEYLPKASPTEVCAPLPHIFVLSAKDEARLKDYASALRAYLLHNEVTLESLAYTLQLGRDEMQERLAVVAMSREEVIAKFAAFVDCDVAQEGVYRGSARSNKAQDGVTDSGEIQSWIERRVLAKLAQKWTQGAVIDWSSLYTASRPRRIAAPTYPFAKERCWMSNGTDKDIAAMSLGRAEAEILHPLVHRNVSTLSEQKFATTFRGDEFYLTDHKVGSQKILPGVVYMEMARRAGELSGNTEVRTIKDMVWQRPVLVDGAPCAVEIVLVPQNGDVDFEVRSGIQEPYATHCSGKIVYSRAWPVAQRLDIAAIQDRCNQVDISREELYAFLRSEGLNLGPSFQAVQSISACENEALSVLRLPDHVKAESDAFWLHPALMDGSLFTAIGLTKCNGMGFRMSLPYSVSEVRIFHSLQGLHYGYACWSGERPKTDGSVFKVDFYLLDREGKVLVMLKDFVALPYQPQGIQVASPAPARDAENDERLKTLVPVWNEVAPIANTSETPSIKVLLLGSHAAMPWLQRSFPDAQSLEFAPDATIEWIAERLTGAVFDELVWIAPDVDTIDSQPVVGEQGALTVFRIAKALLLIGYAERNLRWTLITSRTQQVSANDAVRPAYAGVIGLVGSVAKELQRWDLRMLDLDDLASVSAAGCLTLPFDKQGEAWVGRRGEWFKQRLAIGELLTAEMPAYRDQGVYVVIGGAGGVGEVWTRYMIERHHASVVWIGRTPRNDIIDTKIASLSILGQAPLYLCADATNAADLARARAQILQIHPTIHGVVHSAIVLQDQSFARMEESVFRASLVCKADISVNIDRVFGADALDFMLFFSSIVSFVKPAGQSNYAAGCCFKDAYAQYLREQRPYPVKVMNWGFWGSVGVVADAFHNRRIQQMGIGSIEPEEGMDALCRLMEAALPQCALIKTLTPQTTAEMGASESVSCLGAALPSVLPAVRASVTELFTPKSIVDLEAQLPNAEMIALIDEVLASTLLNLGKLQNEKLPSGAVVAGKQVPAYYECWLTGSIDYLQRRQWLEPGLSLRKAIRPLAVLWSAWETERSAWVANPNLQAQLGLMETCLKALPDVLGGKRRATDVLFPESSMKLVEGIYRGNAMAEYFNHALARVLTESVERWRIAEPNRRFRILEIGAGTGGTTAGLLSLLREMPIDTYCYTDVSKAFLMHAEREYKPLWSPLVTALFDVTKPLAEQGIDVGSYDVVIAANVLHATPNIRETLRNAKALLRKGGVLLLNEIAEWSLFSHLTFGLLEGWWLFDDCKVRLPFSPGLTQYSWQRLLVEEGFLHSFFPCAHARSLGQQIIVASSDGQVRQRIARTVAHEPKPVTKVGSLQTDDAAPVPAAKSHSKAGAGAVRKDRIKRVLVEQLSNALHMEGSRIRMDHPFAEYGVDSIVGVKWVRSISEALGIKLEPTVLFEYGTLEELADHIQAQSYTEIDAEADRRTASDTSIDADVPPPARGASRFSQTPRVTPAKIAASSAKDAGPEPIAIIGMSGRFPMAVDIQAFWENLRGERDCISEIPRSRWDWQEIYGDPATEDNKSNIKWGGFIEGVDEFDPLFFGISPKEAEMMDPQQRLLMMYVWKAIEDAGYSAASLSGSRTAIYAGTGSTGYGSLLAQARQVIKGYSATGLAPSVGPNRMSYLLNLHGPSEPVETACSSSLIALRKGVVAIESGGCEMAIVGGVNTMIMPDVHISFNKAGMLCEDGRCKTFSAQANGYARGEGVGMLVLKRLSAAERDGDHIYGVIRSTAENHGGRANSLTAPNPAAQSELLKEAYAAAGIDPRSIGYVEVHGTGTPLGDPVEVNALKTAFKAIYERAGVAAAREPHCGLGSVKTNIGHLELAAGVAGVIKVLLQLRHKTLVKSLHCDDVNPYIDLQGSPFYLLQQTRNWPAPQGEHGEVLPRRAGVSSFGFGGVNAHVVIEEYVASPRSDRRHSVTADEPALVVLSAKNAERLQEQARQLLAAIERNAWDDTQLTDLAYTLQVGREAMEERLALIVGSMAQLKEKLAAFCEGRGETSDVFRGQVRRNEETLAVFAADEDLSATIDAWIAKRKLSKLLGLWVKGPVFDWNKLYGEKRPQRISLPTYPFTRERCWVPQPVIEPQRASIGVSAHLHPLVQRNTSDLSEQRFSTTLSGDEFFLSDHVVQGRRVLAGVAYLEMAREAVTRAAGVDAESAIRLKNFVWARPVIVGETPLDVHVGLSADHDGSVGFEIYSGENEIHSRGAGEILKAEKVERLDIASLRAQCDRSSIAGADCYRRFTSMGFEYGPALQAIEMVFVGQNQALARLRMPTKVKAAADDYVLHPSMLDAALQACIGLADPTSTKPQVSLPFAVDTVDIAKRCATQMWALVGLDGGAAGDRVRKYDITLCDDDGDVCVRIKGLTSRLVEGRLDGNGQADGALMLLQPLWREQVAAGEDCDYQARHVVLCGISVPAVEADARLHGAHCVALPSNDDLAIDYGVAVRHICADLQTIAKGKPSGPVLIQIVVPGDGPKQAFAGLAGALRTARQEHPKLVGQLIAVEEGESVGGLVAKLVENAACPEDVAIRYAAGRRQTASWHELLPDAKALAPWKADGVYLITGAMGGLGKLFAQEIARRAHGVTLVLSGRRDLDEAGRLHVRQLEALGATVEYRALDIANRNAVREFVLQVQEDHQALNGILHAAGTLHDSLLLNKTPAEIEAVLAPKVAGLVNLDIASREIELDWLIAFSSASAAFGNPGQADYAAANGFLDAFAHYRNGLVGQGLRHGRTVSVNWPLWKDGGMQVDAAVRQRMEQLTGWTGLESEAGIDALYNVLGSGLSQAMVLQGVSASLRQQLLGESKPRAGKDGFAAADRKEKAATLVQDAVRAEVGGDGLQQKIEELLRQVVSSLLKVKPENIDGDVELSEFGFDSITLIEFGNKLNQDYRITLAPTIFFEYSTLDRFAEYLSTEHRAVFAARLLRPADPAETQVPRREPEVDVTERTKKRRSPHERAAATITDPIQTADEKSIAIVGMSGRFAKSESLAQFWENLKLGRTLVGPVTRWNTRDCVVDDSRPYCSSGGFVESIEEFDPSFFGIPAAQAIYMDPQQRLFLEESWRALEDAGYAQKSERARQCGVYVGCSSSNYNDLLKGNPPPPAFWGNSESVVPARVAHYLNLQGPAIAVDTACSSSLVAIHLACQGLWAGETQMAIAGGVSLQATPAFYQAANRAGWLLTEGKRDGSGTRPDGFVPGEGIGVLVLKRMSDAVRDGDTVHGVIIASGVNQNGRSNSLVAPNAKAQENLLRQVYERFNLDPNSIQALETHGSGTQFGDSMELSSASNVFGEKTAHRSYCAIGTVKTNIGHTGSAAGVAGVLKMLLSLRHKQILPSLNREDARPTIDSESSPFYVNIDLKEWATTQPNQLRRAAISAFGFGGTNAHLVVEEPPSFTRAKYEAPGYLILLSAHSAGLLKDQAANLLAAVKDLDDASLGDLSYTLCSGRTHHPHRFACVATSRADLIGWLERWLESGSQDQIRVSKIEEGRPQAKSALRKFGSYCVEECRKAQSADDYLEHMDEIAQLYVQGCLLDYSALFPKGSRRVPLLPYAFARERYWAGVTNEKTLRRHEPRTEAERVLQGIWSQILEITANQIDVNDNFFEIGGNSSRAALLQTRIAEEMNSELCTEDLLACSTLAQMAEAVSACSPSAKGLQTIPKASRLVPLQLSFAQQRIWFITRLDNAANASYNIPMALRMRGSLDVDALRRSLNAIWARHEAWRTVFVADSKGAHAEILPAEREVPFLEHDLRDSQDASATLEQLCTEEARAPFNLTEGPLVRARLVRIEEREYVVMLTQHHIVSDGWSLGVLVRELAALYNAYLHGRASPLRPLRVQYPDYAAWQREWVKGHRHDKQIEYWRGQLKGTPALLTLPTDRPRPPKQSFDGATLPMQVDEELTRKLKQLSQRHGTTLFMTVLAAWTAVLARLAGQNDLVIGTPSANRNHYEIASLVGFFVNTLALRIDLSGEPSVAEVLARVRRVVLDAQTHQDVPFEQVVEIAQAPRQLDQTPVFQVMFAWQNNDIGIVELPGLKAELIGLQMGRPDDAVKFDVELQLSEVNGILEGGISYATALFDAATIDRHRGYLLNVLSAMAASAEQPIAKIDLLGSNERQLLLETWNGTAVSYPDQACIHQLFEQQVERSPDAAAVVFEDQQLSYAQLNARANQLAHQLIERGVVPDSRVAICVERSIAMVVGLLAVLKAGGAYVPLDPAYPSERLTQILHDAAPTIVLADRVGLEALGSAAVANLTAIDPGAVSDRSEENPHVPTLTSKHLAYVIYTSGSTGVPKGALNEHGALFNRLAWMQDAYRLSVNDRVLQKTSFSFDVSVWEFFWPLLNGAVLVVAAPEAHKDPSRLLEIISRDRVSVVHFVPSMLSIFLHQAADMVCCATLRQIMCSGEALSPSTAQLCRVILPHAELHNLYGPTEAAIDVTAWTYPQGHTEDQIPIGRPIANTQIYLLDVHRQPVPTGAVGELYIGGVGVARGYLNRPDLTAERFLPDPFSSSAGARMYRTGDMARYLPDGNIIYIGRNDHQVKIRGFRIELGEIEARLCAHPQISDAVVVAREDSPGDKRLVAYMIRRDAANDSDLATSARSYLLRCLPEHMVPVAFVQLQALPLTPNGKLDRKALPAPEGEAFARQAYEAPIGQVETALAAIWSELLGIERVSRHDSFFSLGGNSLLAVRMIDGLRHFKIHLDLHQLFSAASLSDLANSAIEYEETEL